MADVEADIDLVGRTKPIGIGRSNRVRDAETIVFEYDGGWLEDADRVSLEPARTLTRGTLAPPAGWRFCGSHGLTFAAALADHRDPRRAIYGIIA